MSENIVKGIPGELKQAILNLIQNARDAIEEKMNKSGNVQGLIEVELDCCDSNIRILVRDNGTGIPEEILTDIFNPYFTTKTEGKGTGIGLYMTKIVIKDNLGGEISAFNHEGGAAFEVLIPKEFKGSRS
jgi:signal transduction histidine kinase